MSKYIDAEWLLNFVAEFPDHYTLTVGNLRAVINDAPSIDIVRCKECVEYDDDWCMYWQNVINPDDFCSYGEREGE